VILKVEGLSKQFGGVAAVTDVDFEVEHSEILGMIGPNGAGKTTVINLISGFYPPTKGRIMLSGRTITHMKAHEVARLGIGRTFQASVLFMSLPVIDNVFAAAHMNYKTVYWSRLLRRRAAVSEEEALRDEGERILEDMGLGGLKYELAKNLPHGHQRTLGMCIALMSRPKLLLLDEPLTGMNENEIADMKVLIKGMRDTGISIIMVEHNMQAVVDVCDRIVVLNEGRMIAQGLPREVLQNERVIEAYLGGDDHNWDA
jgi:branched-chain amino acid transport system ATP-binding protein